MFDHVPNSRIREEIAARLEVDPTSITSDPDPGRNPRRACLAVVLAFLGGLLVGLVY